MPYKSNDELPEAVKGALPTHAQTIFRNVFNSTASRGSDEQSSMQQSWAAVKAAGYEKDGKTGRWKRVRKSADPALELVMGGYDDETLDRFLASDEGADVVKGLLSAGPAASDAKAGQFALAKVDEEQRLVFGFFSVNKIGGELVEDLQGDMIETEELEKAAYGFVLDARVAGEGHVRKGVGRLVESVMLSYEKQEAIKECLAKQGINASLDLGCEGWFGGFRIDDDDVWKAVREDGYPAFSIGGGGKRIPIE
jgi:cation transport regulator ChaB